MRLLERDQESTATRALADGVADGRGGLLVIEGPAGIGKSALLAELAERARAADVTVWPARATRLGGAITFGLARWLLGPAVNDAPAVLQAGWARHTRLLFEEGTDGVGERRLLVEGLVALVAELRRSGPLVLIVDDAHWGDSASLEFLDELAARCEDIGVGIAVAIATGQGDKDAGSLRALTARAGEWLLTPAPLSVNAVGDLVAERIPDADERFAGRVAKAAGGNPLLVSGLIESAQRRGTEDLQIPQSLSRAVLLRLDEASRHARALAEAVAVLGVAPLRIAGSLAGLAPRDADRAADELVARGVLAPGEPIHLEQPLLGETLIEALGSFELAARHRCAAQLLSAESSAAGRIGAHLLRSRPAAEAWVCEALRHEARGAIGVGDPALAVELLERALAEPPPAEQHGTLLLELAGAQAAAGRPEAIQTFERALGSGGDPERRADAWCELSGLLYASGDFARAATAGARGRAELPEDHPLAERLLAAELTAASVVPELVAVAIKRLDVLADGPPLTDPALVALLAPHQAARVKRIERVIAMAPRAVAADPLISPASHGTPLIHVTGALNWVDEPVLAERMLDAGLARAVELGDPLAEVNVRCTLAWCRIYQGRLDDAAAALAAMPEASELGWRSVDALWAGPTVVLRLERGDLDGARDALSRVPRGAQIGQAWFDGAVALEAGDPGAALDFFMAAGDELEGVLGIVNPGVIPWRSSAALAAWQLAQLERARSLAAIEVEQARAAACARALGIALRVAGLVGDELESLEESVSVLESSPARLELARSLLHLGIARRRARRPVDARAMLTRAHELALQCSAPA
ncbi:MAG: AAA family ATPase, partial [Solirubrobacteraceae bacterium]